MQATSFTPHPQQVETEIYLFNLHPVAYADPSWLEKTSYPALKAWRHQTLVSQLISNQLLELQSINNKRLVLDFVTPLYLLALLGDWKEIVKLTGAALSWQQVRSIVQRDEVQQVQKILGHEIYNFVLKRAPYLFPNAPGARFEVAIQDYEQLLQQRGVQAWEQRFLVDYYCQIIWPRVQLKLPVKLFQAPLYDPNFSVSSTNHLLKMTEEVFHLWQKSLS